MLLSVIIVSYNTEKLTLQTIESVLAEVEASTLLKDQTEVFVVDNNSQDDTIKTLKAFEKRGLLTLIANSDNPGFSAANNQALAIATGKYCLFLNSDTIVQPGALEKMVTAFEDHPVNDLTAELSSHHGELDKVGILAATLLNPDGSPQPQGGSFPTLVTLYTHMMMIDDLPIIGRLLPSTQHTGRSSRSSTSQALIQQDWVGGTAMMVRRQMMDEIGTLDAGIFMYGEDVEFCVRARDHHWDVAIHPQAVITHFGSASSSSANAIIGELKGYLYIWAKHKPLWQIPIVKTIIRIGAMLRVWVFGTMLNDMAKAAIYKRVLREIK